MIKMQINLPDMERLKKMLGEKYKQAQIMLTNECRKKADYFTPKLDGSLLASVRYFKDYTGFSYAVPYAAKQWYGITDDGTPYDYTKQFNPNASSRWTDRAAAEYSQEILKAVVSVLNEK